LKKLIDDKSDFVLVDTRAGSVFTTGHIIGSINITTNLLDPTSTELKLIGLPGNKLIVFYCD
jgi:rhodanese-related sulfurtransferase